MRNAGRGCAEVLAYVAPLVKPGMTTAEVDGLIHAFVLAQGDASATIGYGAAPGRKAFAHACCTSVNHVVCHGIPGPKVLKKGDIMNIDVTIVRQGFFGDSSLMIEVGGESATGVLARRLNRTARAALWAGIGAVKPGARLADIGAAVQQLVEGEGFSVVRDYCGHGIGRRFHEDPQVLHYKKTPRELRVSGDEQEFILEAGMTFTIEPMVNVGRFETRLLPDGWTVVTRDHSLSAQWEHTVLVTPGGVDVLTLREGETPP